MKPLPDAISKLQADDGATGRIETLAQLTPVEYDQRRKAEAKALDMRVSTLDREVQKRRPPAEKGANDDALFPVIEPWPEPVDGALLLDRLAQAFLRYLVLPEHAAETMALWSLYTHAHDAGEISPNLAFASPEKRCGKTSAQSAVGRVVPRPLHASNITAAALFRAVEKWTPTLLIDEADSFLNRSEHLRGILNSGHARSGANVVRTVGEDHEPKPFKTWAPKCIAYIGNAPGTIEDRAIVISMRRKRPGERVERLRGDRDQGFDELRRQAARWAADHMEALREADPPIPDGLDDRSADNWRPLFAIADLAGDGWGDLARDAAKALTPSEDQGSVGTLLLADVRAIAASWGDPDVLPSGDLCDALVALPDRPWAEIRRGDKPLTTNALARRLKPFGVSPGLRRVGQATLRGYALADFAEPFSRYLPAQPQDSGGQSVTPLQPNEINDLHDPQPLHGEGGCNGLKSPNPSESKGCNSVTVGNRGNGGLGTNWPADESVEPLTDDDATLGGWF